jgi:hypothetical protein
MSGEGEAAIRFARDVLDRQLTLWQEDLIMKAMSVEMLGQRQMELVIRARRSRSHALVAMHTRQFNRERMALRRLVQRGLFFEPRKYGSPALGFIYIYQLTGRGRSCWLKSNWRSS